MIKYILVFLCCTSVYMVQGQTTSFDNLNANTYTNKSITWLSSNYGNGFGHRIINSDPGGQTLLNFQGRHNTATWSNFMTISSLGNIGIGITNPAYKFDVMGDIHFSNSSYLRTQTSTGIGTRIHGINSSNIEYLGAIDQNVSGTIIGTTTDYLNLRTNSISAMFIDSNQKIGIGTTTPLSALHVEDVNPAGDVGITIKNKNATIGTRSVIDFVTTTTNTLYGSIGVENSALGAGAMTFSTRGGNFEKMRITSNGNMGIGTSNPDSKLTVAGKVHAKEVKVTVTAGADFVFEDTYKPLTLKELESFIITNKHLPEIASAKKMETEGVELGAMNIKLLQKIEELTLYTIEQEKELTVQREGSRIQNKKIEDLNLKVNNLDILENKFEQQRKEIQQLKQLLLNISPSKK